MSKFKTVEVQVEVFELTRDDLLSLKSALRGGNAHGDNVDLLTKAAEYLPHDMRTAARERALLIKAGIDRIDNILWPKGEPRFDPR